MKPDAKVRNISRPERKLRFWRMLFHAKALGHVIRRKESKRKRFSKRLSEEEKNITMIFMLSRTKKKLDLFLVKTLETISRNMKSAYEYIKKPKDDEDTEIKNDYKEAFSVLDEIRGNVSSIDDLAELDEDDIGFVYECLSLYEGEFVISHLNSETRKQNEDDYKKLRKLLKLFY